MTGWWIRWDIGQLGTRSQWIRADSDPVTAVREDNWLLCGNIAVHSTPYIKNSIQYHMLNQSIRVKLFNLLYPPCLLQQSAFVTPQIEKVRLPEVS